MQCTKINILLAQTAAYLPTSAFYAISFNLQQDSRCQAELVEAQNLLK